MIYSALLGGFDDLDVQIAGGLLETRAFAGEV
jgi:hypothetical protein